MTWFPLVVGAVRSPLRRRRPAIGAAGAGLRVMTYNVLHDNPDIDGSLAAVIAADCDVVLMQEVSRAWRAALEEAPYAEKRFRLGARGALGKAVLSRLPIVSEELYAPVDRFPAQAVVVEAPSGPLQVLNVHLRPAIDRGSWVRGYVTTPPIRRREIEAYWARLDASLPTVVAGDFNEVPSGSAVRFLETQGLTLAVPSGPATWHHVRKGRDLLRLDIDHVLAGRGVSVLEAEVLDVGSSDHRPVVARLG